MTESCASQWQSLASCNWRRVCNWYNIHATIASLSLQSHLYPTQHLLSVSEPLFLHLPLPLSFRSKNVRFLYGSIWNHKIWYSLLKCVARNENGFWSSQNYIQLKEKLHADPGNRLGPWQLPSLISGKNIFDGKFACILGVSSLGVLHLRFRSPF